MARETVTNETLPAVRRSITVPWTVDVAFRRFTAELGSWWPLGTHSVGGSDATTCVFEGRAGGSIYEVHRNGGRSVWGTVLEWSPPRHVAFTWHPGDEASNAQRIDVRFEPLGERTRLTLEHGGWERHRKDASRRRRAYGLGWVYVLRHYAGQTRAPIVLVLDALVPAMRALRRKRA